MTWIKICGITNLEDAWVAVEAGADALGFVFYEKSPRRVDAEMAQKIITKLPSRMEKIGVVVNQAAPEICSLAERIGLTGVQFHGDQGPPAAKEIAARRPDLKLIAAVAMRDLRPAAYARDWCRETVYAFLLDSGDSSRYGGTGETFDWEASRAALVEIAKFGNVIVAGGLKPANVAEAIHLLRPWGVDVASGVEAKPGKKDPEKVRAFVAAVRQPEKAT